MMPSSPGIHFKFTHAPSGYTRRISFPAYPSWQSLASKIETLYAIPAEKVGVSYIDADNDEVTLSTDEELQDFYSTSHQSDHLIKFQVLDLSSPRPPRSTSFPTAPSAHGENTFGVQEDAFDLDEWQRVPLFSAILPTDGVPHAFVEVLDSNASSVSAEEAFQHQEDNGDDDNSTVKSVPAQEPTPASMEKGKGKAVSTSEFSSAVSVLAENTSQKHPIHIYAVSTHEDGEEDSTPVPGTFPSKGNPVVAESTPKTRVRGVEEAASAAVENDASSSEDVADPPLPTIENTTDDASLSNDVAALLANLGGVMGSHPELSEGLRNIVQNISNGTYWRAHRDSLSQAANDLANSASDTARDARRRAEEEAGKRVAEALGGLFRALSVTVLNAGEDDPNHEGQAADTRTHHSSHHGFGSNNTYPSQQHPLFSGQYWGNGWHNVHSYLPPPPPPAFYRAGPPPPPPTAPVPPDPPSLPRTGLPPFMPPPPMGPRGHNPFIPPFGRSPLVEVQGLSPSGPPTQSSRGGQSAQDNPVLPSSQGDHEKPQSPEELRAQVEAAKKAYKVTKEQYRQERETRRRQKETDSSFGLGSNVQIGEPGPSTVPHVFGSTRLPMRGADVFSVRRHNTHPGHGAHHHHHGGERRIEDLNLRALGRIIKRLSDMGFTENGHPELGSKIKAQLPSGRTITKDDEDNIVTLVLEELLATAPKPLGTSASVLRDERGA